MIPQGPPRPGPSPQPGWPPPPRRGAAPQLQGISASGRWRADPGRAAAGTLQIGPYQVLELLGRGGMGVVYRARDLASGRDVAVKLVLDAMRPDRHERFVREGQIAAALSHPGIVRVHAAGEFQGRPYLAYELVEGARPLTEAFAELPLTERVQLVVEAARALGASHAQGVVHRDVKPDNLLVDRAGRLRVADFGLALAADLERLTQTGAIVGTPHYMAPEQFDHRSDLGPPCDVWALGVVLYEALTGELPFAGDSIHILVHQISEARPQPPRGISGEVTPALEAVCLQALRPEADQRYPHGDALADDLERALRGEAVEASLPSALPRTLRRLAWVALPLGAFLFLGAALAYDPQPEQVATGEEAGSAPSEAPLSVVGPGSEPPADGTEPPGELEPSARTLGPDEVEELARGAAPALRLQDGLLDFQFAELYKDSQPARALKHYRQAAAAGHPRAMKKLAEWLREGRDAPQDLPAALEWFRRAGEAGEKGAMNSAASLLEQGAPGVPADPREAYDWRLRAAQAGDGLAMWEVGRMLRDGVGVEADPAQGAEWRRQARKQGFRPKREYRKD